MLYAIKMTKKGNVTLRRVHSTNVAVEKNNITYPECVCVYIPSYPACNALAPSYIVCSLSGSIIFFHVRP